MGLSVEGVLHEIFEIEKKSEKFRKREFVLEMENGQGWQEYPKFQLTQDRCLLIDQYEKGSKVRVHFDLSGRPYNGRDGRTIYFTNLNVWKIESLDVASPPAPEAPQAGSSDMPDYVTQNVPSGPPPSSDSNNDSGGNVIFDDLPF